LCLLARCRHAPSSCFFRATQVFRSRGRDKEFIKAVKDVSYSVQPGECFGLLGPNGAGKTTTISAITNEVVRCVVTVAL
jgi:ABC-type multidrug transport system ATPase subunit